MIFIHPIIGALPISDNHFSWFWFIGSVVPDLDHIFAIIKYKIFSWKKLVNSVRFEEKFKICYKTKYAHSLLGAIIFSLIVFLIDRSGAIYFFAGYALHLALDWPDCEEKQFLFPLKIKFKGFLPIFSKPEILFTILFIGIIFFIFSA